MICVEGELADHQLDVSSPAPPAERTGPAADPLSPARPRKPADIQQASLRLLSVQGLSVWGV